MWSNDMKCEYMFVFPLQNLACKELTNNISMFMDDSLENTLTEPVLKFHRKHIKNCVHNFPNFH